MIVYFNRDFWHLIIPALFDQIIIVVYNRLNKKILLYPTEGSVTECNVMNVILDLQSYCVYQKFWPSRASDGLPQVVGMVIAGLVIGPAIFSQFGWSFQGLINPLLRRWRRLTPFLRWA